MYYVKIPISRDFYIVTNFYLYIRKDHYEKIFGRVTHPRMSNAE